eukprot:7184440-Prymnesium_polylepis.1
MPPRRQKKKKYDDSLGYRIANPKTRQRQLPPRQTYKSTQYSSDRHTTNRHTTHTPQSPIRAAAPARHSRKSFDERR